MHRLTQRFLPALLVLALFSSAGPARGLEETDAAVLANAYFDQIYGFDALAAYESRRGGGSASFAVARRWRDGRAKILIDVLKPSSFSKWALLLLHNTDRSDDLFAYVPAWRKVTRLTAIDLETQVLFQLFPLGEFRPIAAGELAYRSLPDAVVEGEECIVVEGRPRHRGLGFDRVELSLSRKSGLALQSRFYRKANEIRRVLVSPEDIREYGDRLLPERRRILTPPDTGYTELILRNLDVDPVLPDSLFTQHNLRLQRFPSF